MKYLFYFIMGSIVAAFVWGLTSSTYRKLDAKRNIPTATATPIVSPTITPTPTSLSSSLSSSSQLTSFKVAPQDVNGIQNAVDRAMPGDVIELEAGEYFQDIVSKRSGLPGLPIIIKGPKEAVVKGGGGARVIQINHSYITLDGFTVDGLFGTPDNKSGYRDKLIYAIGTVSGQGPSHNRFINMTLKNAGGECIRLRYFAQNNEIAYNQIGPCGLIDFRFGGGGKNGEGIYVGTAPEQRGDKKNPDTQVDQSNNNYIHHNNIDTQGNECVDIKEGTSGTIVEYNSCKGQEDPESGGLDSRGNGNTFRFNTVSSSRGAGIRLGGDGEQDGINNDVYQNTLIGNQNGGIKFQRSPQGKICGNKMQENKGGDSVGSYGEEFDPVKSC